MLAAIPFVLAAGLASRAWLAGELANFLGVALWTVMLYAVLLLVRPRLGPLRATLAAAAIGVGVELSQRTPYPRQAAEALPILHSVIGAYFDAKDLPAYLAGALAAGALHAARLRDRPR